jgi:hypothetical protein
MEPKVTVKLKIPRPRKSRLRKHDIRAFGDVTLDLGDSGAVRLRGFKVIACVGQPPLVLPPARQGYGVFSSSVILKGSLQSLVERAVREEYERACVVGHNHPGSGCPETFRASLLRTLA